LAEDSIAKSPIYEAFEGRLIGEVFQLGRLLIALFLCRCEERYPARAKERHGKELYRRQPPKPRLVLRFMDWNRTNGSSAKDWSQRTKKTASSQRPVA